MLSIFKSDKKYNIGLVLSGGAARGFAHLGILQALEENNLKPDIISGVSAGAIAGAFYADGYSPIEILQILKGKKMWEYVRLAFKRQGLMKITGLDNILRQYLRANTFEE
ncbi:MAG: phospholipase, partial [Bacteroidales bacterium]|nr:phospholipase [Bacteroidales bacterium]